MPLVLGGSAAAAGAFSVDNSCRFNVADSPGLVQTPLAGDPDKWTFSCWFKRNNIISGTYLLTCVDGSNDTSIGLNSGAALFWTEYQGGTVGKLQTNRPLPGPVSVDAHGIYLGFCKCRCWRSYASVY